MELFLQFVSLNWYLFAVLSAFVAALLFYENRKAGPSIGNQELSSLINKSNAVVVDVRAKADFSNGHIVGALNIPSETFASRKGELEKHKSNPIVVVCNYGQSSGAIAKQLREDGYDVSRLRGGITEWSGANLPTVRG